MWPQVVLMIVAFVVSYAMQPKPPTPKAPALSDFEFPQIDEGTPQVVVFGDAWVDSWMVLGVGNFRTIPVKSGGK